MTRARRGLAFLLAAAAVIAGAASAAAAPAADPAAIAGSLEADPVYVHPERARELTPAARGRVRMAIATRDIGRIKVAVVPERVAQQAGGAGELARRIANGFELKGVLVLAAGSTVFALTSYPDSAPTVAAVSRAVEATNGQGLGDQLVEIVKRVAAVDPGASADISPAEGVPVADDFLDGIADAFRLGVLIVAAAVALPFLLVTTILVVRYRRRREREVEVEQWDERTAREQLVGLGDGIRSLDTETSQPGAGRLALLEYEHALTSYDQANDLLLGDPGAYQVEQAQAAIAAGQRHLDAARRLLDPSAASL